MKASYQLAEALNPRKQYVVWCVTPEVIASICDSVSGGDLKEDDALELLTDADCRSVANYLREFLEDDDLFFDALHEVCCELVDRVTKRPTQALADEIKASELPVVSSNTMKTSESVPHFVSLDEELPDPSLLTEANSDGTRSEGEEEQATELIDGITGDVKAKIRKAAIKLHRLGGPFRSGAYLQRLMQGVNQAVTDAVKDEAVEVKKGGKKSKQDPDKEPQVGRDEG
jgi:hypothetical protein